MLRQVSNGQYLDAIRMAEKFILHVEVLFGAIDDLEHHFASNGLKGTHAASPWAGLFKGGTIPRTHPRSLVFRHVSRPGGKDVMSENR